jgi:hypothetical protein
LVLIMMNIEQVCSGFFQQKVRQQRIGKQSASSDALHKDTPPPTTFWGTTTSSGSLFCTRFCPRILISKHISRKRVERVEGVAEGEMCWVGSVQMSTSTLAPSLPELAQSIDQC